MINNNDYDINIFKELISCAKLGGYIIFATKLNFHNKNIYENEIQELIDKRYW